VYAIYLRVGHNTESRLITIVVLFAIGGTAMDLVANVFPDRGAWAAGVALGFLVKNVHSSIGPTSTQYHVGLILAVLVIGMIVTSEVYKLWHYPQVTEAYVTKDSVGLPFQKNLPEFLKNGIYRDSEQ